MRRSYWLIISLIFIPTLIFANNTREYHLPNGLKLIVREDHRAPVVISSVWYKVGGSYETNGITGISHMLEHMMFQGTLKYGPGELNKFITQVGGEQNAMTADDYTMYYQTLSADQLPLSFQLESDRMRNLSLGKSAFEKEMKVVMEERRMRVEDNPQGQTWERFRAAAFVNNPYHHPVIGWMTDLKHMTVDDVKTWYNTWYAPNNAVLIVVGDIKSNDVFELAKKYFGPLQSSDIPTLKPRTEISALGMRNTLVNIPAKLSWLVMGYNVPTLATIDKAQQKTAYALVLAANLLSAGDSARLPETLIRKKQIAVSADANYDLYDLHQSLFVLTGIPSEKHTISQLKHALLSEINALKTKPISDAELQRIKTQFIADKVYRRDSLMQQVMHLGIPEMTGLSWRDGDQLIKNIDAITPKDIYAAVTTYLIPKNLTIAILTPISQEKPNG